MRMLRWMRGKTRKNRIRNIGIRDTVGIEPIEAKLRENNLGGSNIYVVGSLML